MLHVYWIAEELAGGGAVAGGEEVAAAELFGSESHDFRDLVHVAFEREDALVDFARSASEIYNRWRGFQPWPGAYTFFRGKKLTLHRLIPSGSVDAPLGELMLERDRLFVAAGSATRLELLELQLEGKKRMPVADFLRGATPRPHERLGE